jgi:hypothetical protein
MSDPASSENSNQAPPLLSNKQDALLTATTPPGNKKPVPEPELDPDQTLMVMTCGLLNCSPPQFKMEDYSSREKFVIAGKMEVEGRIRADGLAKFLLTDSAIPKASDDEKMQAIILLSLYGRNYLKHKTKKDRVTTVRMILKKNTSAYHQARRLFGRGDSSKNALGLHPDLVAFVEQYGMENECSPGFNIFRGHHIPMCCRIQLSSGTCYIHAAMVIAAYKAHLCKAEKGGDLELVDMYKYFRQSADDDELTKLLITGGEGSSRMHLFKLAKASQTMIGFRPKNFVTKKASAEAGALPTCELVSFLQEHGPGLVSEFVVEDCFLQATNNSPTPLLKPETNTGRIRKVDHSSQHAMVLVGVRMVEDKWYALLQNWWEKMPFIEISAEYLVSSDAWLSFIEEKEVSMPSYFDRCNALYAEADLEGNDKMPNEG